MTAQGDAGVDVESLRKSIRRPLDAFLLTSVTFLFLAVAAIGALAAIDLKKPEVAVCQDQRGSPQDAYKVENFAYLEAKSSKLGNLTMSWRVVEHGNGTSKGNLFDFDPEHFALQPKRAGVYFMYVDLNLTCTHLANCGPGRLTVQVGDLLTCEVELESKDARMSRKCWTVSRVDKRKLLAQMTVPENGLSNWKLELKGSGWGMFLVD